MEAINNSNANVNTKKQQKKLEKLNLQKGKNGDSWTWTIRQVRTGAVLKTKIQWGCWFRLTMFSNFGEIMSQNTCSCPDLKSKFYHSGSWISFRKIVFMAGVIDSSRRSKIPVRNLGIKSTLVRFSSHQFKYGNLS